MKVMPVSKRIRLIPLQIISSTRQKKKKKKEKGMGGDGTNLGIAIASIVRTMHAFVAPTTGCSAG